MQGIKGREFDGSHEEITGGKLSFEVCQGIFMFQIYRTFIYEVFASVGRRDLSVVPLLPRLPVLSSLFPAPHPTRNIALQAALPNCHP